MAKGAILRWEHWSEKVFRVSILGVKNEIGCTFSNIVSLTNVDRLQYWCGKENNIFTNFFYLISKKAFHLIKEKK